MIRGKTTHFDMWIANAVFSDERLFAHPGSLAKYDSRRRKSVCVIGGGAAGLLAAFELDSLGHQVTLLEASQRWGGRIFTHQFADGTYGELGAMRVPVNHLCVDHYVDEFNLKKRTFVPRNDEAWYLCRGIKDRRRNWPQIAARIRAYEVTEARRQNRYFLT